VPRGDACKNTAGCQEHGRCTAEGKTLHRGVERRLPACALLHRAGLLHVS
jgi:hypothetical protein